MGSREEFDWDRMRREEEAYASVRKLPGRIGPVIRRVFERAIGRKPVALNNPGAPERPGEPSDAINLDAAGRHSRG